MTRTAILGVGHHAPSKVVTNHDLAARFDTNDEWIVQRTGIRERRYIDADGVGPAALAVPAVEMACARAEVAVRDLDAIVFATLSPDAFFPGSGCFLQERLGLRGVPALDVRNQCSGFLYGLSVADAWIRAGVYKRVLLVGAEVHSTGLDFSDAGRDVTVLFGDGAGAVVLGPTDDPDRGVLSIDLHADGAGARDLWIEAPSSASHPDRISPEMLASRRHYTQMNGRQVFRWATEKMPETARKALADAGHAVGDVDLFVPHQANLRINELVARKLGVPMERVVTTLDRFGNTTAASIPLSLSEAWGDGRAKRGDLVLFAAFGSGYTWGAAVARL
ncbi:MAG: beta-ketoacyl-ACP synthase III [Polyangiales bacterium]